MRKLSIFAVLLSLFLVMFATSSASAQEDDTPELSQGCTILENLVQDFTPDELDLTPLIFVEGETITLTVTGTGNSFALADDTVILETGVAIGDTITYEIPSEGTYQFIVTVANGDATTQISFTCTPPETVSVEDLLGDGPYTLCHIPPGNPEAAHTITVGSLNAALTHIERHGDTIGACAPNVQARQDLFTTNVAISIFTLRESGLVQVFGACSDSCTPVAFINISVLIPQSGFVVEVDEDEDDDWEALVYYLHDFPFNANIDVYQVNIMVNGVLEDDSLLIFVHNGELLTYGTHESWFDEAFIERLLSLDIELDLDIDLFNISDDDDTDV